MVTLALPTMCGKHQD